MVLQPKGYYFIRNGLKVLAHLQFINTLVQLLKHEGINPFEGLSKYFSWQVRKLLGLFPTTLKISNSYMHIDQNSATASLVNCMDIYDFNNMNLIKTYLDKNGGSFFDIGANIGSYTLVASEAAGATVVSCEPNLYVFQSLARNIEINSRNNVMAVNYAISDHDGIILFVEENASEMSYVTYENPNLFRPVQCRTIDSLCRELSVWPTIIKIDVEGHGKEVLKGFLDDNKITEIIIIEDGVQSEIKESMVNKGFVGPWFFHFSRMLFDSTPQKRAEDPIFVRKNFIEKSATYNIKFC